MSLPLHYVKNEKEGKVATLQVMPNYLYIDADPLVIDKIENIACPLVGSAADPETRYDSVKLPPDPLLGYTEQATCELPLLSHEKPRELIMLCNLFEHQKTFTLLCAHRF